MSPKPKIRRTEYYIRCLTDLYETISRIRPWKATSRDYS